MIYAVKWEHSFRNITCHRGECCTNSRFSFNIGLVNEHDAVANRAAYFQLNVSHAETDDTGIYDVYLKNGADSSCRILEVNITVMENGDPVCSIFLSRENDQQLFCKWTARHQHEVA